MGWIDKLTDESASNLKTRLEGLNACIVLSGTPGASFVAYSADGLILRQVVSTVVTEYRGLTRHAAALLSTLTSDDTTRTIYYHGIGAYTGTGSHRIYSEYVACGVTTGVKHDYAAARANEADGWKVVHTQTTYSAGATNDWTTTRPSAATTSGIVTGRSSSSSYLYAYNHNPIYTTETSTTTEYRFLTKSEAETMVSQNNTNNTQMNKWLYGSSTVYAYAWKGTAKTATSRYIDADNGFTVTVTEKTVSAQGTNWTDKGAA